MTEHLELNEVDQVAVEVELPQASTDLLQDVPHPLSQQDVGNGEEYLDSSWRIQSNSSQGFGHGCGTDDRFKG